MRKHSRGKACRVEIEIERVIEVSCVLETAGEVYYLRGIPLSDGLIEMRGGEKGPTEIGEIQGLPLGDVAIKVGGAVENETHIGDRADVPRKVLVELNCILKE